MSIICSIFVNKNKYLCEGSSNILLIRRNGGILLIIDNEFFGDLCYVFFIKSFSLFGFNIVGGNVMGIFVLEI